MSLDNGRLYSQRITLCNQSDTVKIGMCYYVLKMIAGNYCLSTALFYSILTRIYRSKGTIMSYDHAPHVDYNMFASMPLRATKLSQSSLYSQSPDTFKIK